MDLKKLFLKIIRRKINCVKCDSPSLCKKYCKKCQEYNSLLKEKREKEILAKDDLKRRSWIESRDLFLTNQHGG